MKQKKTRWVILLVIILSFPGIRPVQAQDCTIGTRSEYVSGRYYAKFKKSCNRSVTIYYKRVFADGSEDANGMEYMPASMNEATGRSSVEDFRIVITNTEWGESETVSQEEQSASQNRSNWKKVYCDDEVYEGEFLNGKKHGYGIYTWDDGQRYEGEWRNGVFHGYGKVTWPDGDTYEGDFRYGTRTGKGRYEDPEGEIYEGEWNDNKRHGYGKLIYKNGNRYEGEFSGGLREGRGVLTWRDGGMYDGEWKKGSREGKGYMEYTDGMTYTGDWVGDNREGRGILTWVNGGRYEGEFKENGRTGKGTYHKDGLEECVKNCPDCVRYEGEWYKGMKNGYGTCYNTQGGIIYKGRFKDDKPTGTYPSVN